MISESSHEIGVAYLDLASDPDALPEAVRLRAALDVLAQLAEECAPSLGARGAKSRLRLRNVRVGVDGTARVAGSGDTSGAQLLLWELLAAREAPEGALPRVHDVVDEIDPDVDDVVTKAAVERRIASIDELLEALEEVALHRAAPRELLAALATGTPLAAAPVAEPRVDRAASSEPSRAAHADDPVADPSSSGLAAASQLPTERVGGPAPASVSADTGPSAVPTAPAPEPTASDFAGAETPSELPTQPRPPAPASSSPPSAAFPSPPPRQSETRIAATPAVDAVIGPAVLVIGAAAEDGALRSAIERANHRVICVELAKARAAIEAEHPSCVVLDVWLEDGAAPSADDDDGFRFVRWMRTDDSHASAIPLLLIAPGPPPSQRGDAATAPANGDAAAAAPHLAGFLVGADVCVNRPYRVDDVVAQVGALVRMSTRLRAAREWLRSRPVQKAFEGNLAHVSIATLLSVLEMERRTGVFEVAAPGRRVELHFEMGCAVRGKAQGLSVSALGALESMLGCDRGRFSFTPLPERDAPQTGVGIGELLLEALRRRDEEAREAAEQGAAGGATR